jgi:hypothetical protein
VVFQFEHPERSVGDNVRQAAKAEFDLSIAEISETGFEVHGTVRNVRRRLKRVRSLLRLIAPVFPDGRREDRVLRGISAEVRGLRDVMALVEAADGLARGGAGGDVVALGLLRLELANRAAEREEALDRDALLGGLRGRLRDARVRSEVWELEDEGRKALIPGFVDTYRRARKCLRRAKGSGAERDFHEWRKEVKHHASHLSVLRGLVPPFASGRLRRTRRLAIALGDLQNLCVLGEALRRDPTLASEPDRTAIMTLCEKALAQHRRRSLKLGESIFAETTRLVEARWEAYWLDWQAARRMARNSNP